MAYTLKASGISTNAKSVVAVNQDGTTITEFVTGRTIALGTGVAASVSTATWKSVSRGFWETTANGSFDFFGVTWTGSSNQPAMTEDDADGVSVWFACNGASSNSNDGPFVCIGAGNGALRGLSRALGGTNKGIYKSAGTPVAATTTSLPTDGTTKFSFGASYRSNNSSAAYYGLESGSLTQEATAAGDGGFGGSNFAWNIGGAVGQGNQPFRPFCVALFDKILTTGEFQSLHDDWFGTLFDAPAAAAPSLLTMSNNQGGF
jgi:hypothetical protein